MKKLIHATLLVALMAAGPAHATLVGDDVTIYEIGINPPNPPIGNVVSVLVQESVTEINNGLLAIDIEAESIKLGFITEVDLTPFAAFDFFGFVFADLDWQGGVPGFITGFDLLSNIPTLNDSHVEFGPNQIAIDLKGVVYQPGDWFMLNLEHMAVPLPAAFWLFATGLIGIAARARRGRGAR